MHITFFTSGDAMPARLLPAACAVVLLLFSTPASADLICGKMSIDCFCTCANGMQLNWEDEFKLQASCSGFLCANGCRTDISKAAETCYNNHVSNCRKICREQDSQLKELCAEQDGGYYNKGDSCYTFN